MTSKWEVIVNDVAPEFNRIAAFDGNLVNFEREARFAVQTLENNDALARCTQTSIRNAIVNVAAVGLTLNPAMKLAYLVPRDGKACLDISYIGLVKIATDTGSVAAVKCEIVRKNDQFEYNGPFEKPRHKFNPFASDAERGEIIGIYTIAKLTNGIDMIDCMDAEEINKIRNVSKAKSGPWQTWFEEMAKKAGIKRASKMWTRTERMSKAEEILNEHQGNEIDITPRNTTAAAQAAQIEHVVDTPERQKLLADLDIIAREQGSTVYSDMWQNKMTREQRQLIGVSAHETLKQLAKEFDEGAAQ